MSLNVTNPTNYKVIEDYSDTVASWCESFNNNSVLATKLASNSIGSGVINSGVGSISGYKSTAIPNPENLDPHAITLDGWTIFFSDICSMVMFNKYTIDLDPEGSTGVRSDGIRYLYVKSDGTHSIERSESTALDGSKVYLMRYELYDNKIVNALVIPDVAGTDPLARTQLANQTIQVYDCVVAGVAGTTSLSLSACKMLLEGGNIYGTNSSNDKNLVEVPAKDKAEIYYCDGNDLFHYHNLSEKSLIVDTDHYKVSSGDNNYEIADLPDGKFSIQQFSLSPDGILVGQYSSSAFNTMSEAMDAITTESFNFINLNKNDIYSPVLRIAYQSGAVNSADPTKFKPQMIHEEGQVVAGGSEGGVVQGQISNLAGRIDVLEHRNNIIVTTEEGVSAISGLRNHDMIMIIKGDY